MSKQQDKRSWNNATWEGSRKSQLKAALRLSYKERFQALEDMSNTSEWLANAKLSGQQVNNRS